MAIQALASEGAGPLALLKVFTSFFSEKQEKKMESRGWWDNVGYSFPPAPLKMSELSQPPVKSVETEEGLRLSNLFKSHPLWF